MEDLEPKKDIKKGKEGIWIATVALVISGCICFDTAIRVGVLMGVFPPGLIALFLVFGLLFLSTAYGTLKVKKWGFIGGLALCIIFLVLEGPQIPIQLSEQLTDPGFYAALTFITASIIAIFAQAYNFYSRRVVMTVRSEVRK